MSHKLFESNDRAASHAELERVMKGGKHPLAECREYPSEAQPYTIWDGPQDARSLSAEEQAESDRMLESLLATQEHELLEAEVARLERSARVAGLRARIEALKIEQNTKGG